jgi:RimJ/RimL family protein N-acetyltransferase
LRQFTEADASLIHLLNSDPEVIKYVPEPLLKSKEEAKEIIRQIILPQYKNNLGRWAILTKSNTEFIGWCGLKYLEDDDEIDLGYRFFKTAWGKGYATESAKYVLDHGFNRLHLKEIMGKAHIENIASINVLQKIGMQFIKDIVEHDSLVKVFHAVNHIV